eukprot:9373957-Lingulodinium_polyedra.AAC.1
MAVENGRCWPRHQQLLLYFLVLKPDGKDRPIGLLASLVRLWEALRVLWLREWLRSNPKHWGLITEGATCEQA